MGCSRTRRILWSKRNIPRACMVLPHRGHRTNYPVALRTQQEEEHRPKNQPPRPLWQPQLDPTSHRSELLRLGSRLLYLQLRHPQEGNGMVGQVHHDPERGAGFGIGIWFGGGVLWVCVPGLDEWIQLVGNGDL